MASVIPQCDALVAHMPGVKAAVRAEAGAIEARARGLLGAHRDTGATRIVMTRQDTDVLVGMVDNGKHGSAVAIEFGGTRTNGTTIAGLFILHRAAGLPGGA